MRACDMLAVNVRAVAQARPMPSVGMHSCTPPCLERVAVSLGRVPRAAPWSPEP